MRSTYLLPGVILLLGTSVSAEETRPLKFDQPGSAKSLPVKPPKYDASCAAYGAGFVKLAGTDTCVKVGGYVSVGAGGSVGAR
jgi:Porin subfamily